MCVDQVSEEEEEDKDKDQYVREGILLNLPW